MNIHWTPTYTAIAAALISSSLLSLLTEPVQNRFQVRKTFRGWQAVFLSNNQVYFGRITSISRYDITLEQIFYLAITGVGNFTERDAMVDDSFIKNGAVKVIKLGKELHAPEDNMIINRTQIQFMENLNKNGEVVNSIEHYILGEKLADVDIVTNREVNKLVKKTKS